MPLLQGEQFFAILDSTNAINYEDYASWHGTFIRGSLDKKDKEDISLLSQDFRALLIMYANVNTLAEQPSLLLQQYEMRLGKPLEGILDANSRVTLILGKTE